MRQPGVRIFIEQSQLIGGLLLRQIGFRRRQIALRLTDSTIGIHLGLARFHGVLPQLIFEHPDLLARTFQPCLSLRYRRLRLRLTVPQLLVVQHRDYIARLHLVPLAHFGFQQATGGFRRYRRVVAFNPSAQVNHIGGAVRLRQHHAPNRHRAGRQQQHD